jgi:molybdenum cofactor sulfurtransferase
MSLAQAEAAFLAATPAFRETRSLDALRAREHARLDADGIVYLDYGGGGLPARSQFAEHHALLRDAVLGNPHSANPTSSAATALVERARAAVLRFFNAAERDYDCVFTANATGALRLVGEAFPFAPGGRLLVTADNHNSVNGLREFARAKGARAGHVPVHAPDLRVDEAALARHLDAADPERPNLFAYPAQSNFSGVKHPLEWIALAQQRGWTVLLDAAAFAPTSLLDLTAHEPDFIAISFYKLFGYPTGLGALLARHDALERLRRPWFSGGTVVAASVEGDLAVLAPGHAGFEDGTVDYLGIPAVEVGLRHLERVGIDTVARRVEALGTWLLDGLARPRHADGRPAAVVYGPPTWDRRGGTIALNFLHPDGRVVDERHVDALAAAQGISLRTGCFCNPGAGEAAFALDQDALRRADFDDASSLDDFLGRIGMRTGGAVRVSLGLVSNFADVWRFMTFAAQFCDLAAVPAPLPPRLAC